MVVFPCRHGNERYTVSAAQPFVGVLAAPRASGVPEGLMLRGHCLNSMDDAPCERMAKEAVAVQCFVSL